MSYEEIISDINSGPNNVCLIAVSKKQSAEKIENIILKGHNDFGENQLQEVENKWIALKKNIQILLYILWAQYKVES